MANGVTGSEKQMRKIFNKTDTFGKAAGAFGVAMDVYSGVHDGKGFVKSVASAGVSFVMNDILTSVIGMPAMMAIQFAPMIADAAGAVGKMGREKAKHNMTALSSGNVGGGYFQDNEYGATMRQRQLQAMGGDTGQIRSAFGNEARRRATNTNY